VLVTGSSPSPYKGVLWLMHLLTRPPHSPRLKPTRFLMPSLHVKHRLPSPGSRHIWGFGVQSEAAMHKIHVTIQKDHLLLTGVVAQSSSKAVVCCHICACWIWLPACEGFCFCPILAHAQRKWLGVWGFNLSRIQF